VTSPTTTLLNRIDPATEPLVWVLPEPEPGLKDLPQLRVVHSFRPEVLALKKLGVEAGPAWPDDISAIALTLPRQAAWAAGLMAQGLERLRPGGRLYAVARNDRGGKRYAKMLAEAFDLAFSESKNHCRLVALDRPAQLPAAVSLWKKDYAPQQVEGRALLAMPGTFSSEHIDPGSALLVRHLPPLEGRVADFGAGWGYLSHCLLGKTPAPMQIDLFEADDNALAMARLNLAPFAAKTGFYWHDLLAEPCPRAYDAIIMNPPFHDMQDANPEIGREFIRAAARALKPEGVLWMVANRRLPYEDVLKASFRLCESVAEDGGYKIHRERQ
jgi:16S rRNA (guanine1207-N2)-methyltransferase